MSKLTYNKQEVVLNDEGYLILPFGEVHINTIKKDYADIEKAREKYPQYIYDEQYINELVAIIKEADKLNL